MMPPSSTSDTKIALTSWFLILILTFTGCSASFLKTVVSPSRNLYDLANEAYDLEFYDEAIEHYTQFLDANPRSSLATPAKLNLGMSYYYTQDYQKAYETLKYIRLNDEPMKNYVTRVIQSCEIHLKDTKDIQPTPPILETTSTTSIHINIIDAYLDDYGALTLSGHILNASKLTINNAPVLVNTNNTFTTTLDWRKGEAINIFAQENGQEEELIYFPDAQQPNEPENLRVSTATSNSIEIEWDENKEDDIKGYRVFYQLKGRSLQRVPELITDTHYEAFGLEKFVQGSNRTFKFYLKAIDKMNNISEDSDILETMLPLP